MRDDDRIWIILIFAFVMSIFAFYAGIAVERELTQQRAEKQKVEQEQKNGK